jgi:hypothetical protein
MSPGVAPRRVAGSPVMPGSVTTYRRARPSNCSWRVGGGEVGRRHSFSGISRQGPSAQQVVVAGRVAGSVMGTASLRASSPGLLASATAAISSPPPYQHSRLVGHAALLGGIVSRAQVERMGLAGELLGQSDRPPSRATRSLPLFFRQMQLGGSGEDTDTPHRPVPALAQSLRMPKEGPSECPRCPDGARDQPTGQVPTGRESRSVVHRPFRQAVILFMDRPHVRPLTHDVTRRPLRRLETTPAAFPGRGSSPEHGGGVSGR